MTARELILKALLCSSEPISAPEILRRLVDQGVSFNKTTIYRELEALRNSGSIREIFFRNDKALYELPGEHHHHLVCTSCGNVRDVAPRESFADEEKEILRRESFLVLEHSLEFFGLCRSCR